MNSREETHSVWDEMEENRQKLQASYLTENIPTTHGDVMLWDLDDIDTTSGQLTPRIIPTPPVDLGSKTGIIPKSPTLSNLTYRLSTGSGLETKLQRQTTPTPRDARFRDVIPNPEMKPTVTNRFGQTNAGGAFVIDNNITMYGDVMMLDLDSEDEGHSPRICTAVEKFSQLVDETPRVDVSKPAKTRRTTTGIRHLMAIRNPELSEHPEIRVFNTENKRKKKKRKSKRTKIHRQSPDGQTSSSVITTPEVTDNNRKLGFVKLIGYQMSRFGTFIHKKLICH
ncbi:uncharacterized protein [Argopecten irradians]|uniref:uncharacterized protein isoform X2 n=1 Tax=Argopecten irradians TaxID=31199 RepID=UPI00371D28AD